jgi:pimeloyl-ACP methyl ester carboxylesterase
MPSYEQIPEIVRSKDGTPIACWRSGAGEPLLLVHGTICDHTAWAQVQPALERHFSVWAMDRRGRGHSGDAPAYAHQREAEDIATVIDAIGGPVNVLGHSFGALCSLEAMLLTTNVRRLILYEPPMAMGGRDLPPEPAARMQAFLDAGEKEQALLVFCRDVFKIPEQEIAFIQASPAWPVSVAIAHTIPRECKVVDGYTFDQKRFHGMETPTVLFVGSVSPPPQHGIAETVHAALPLSSIVLLPGEHHNAPTTAPDLLANEVLKFFTGPLQIEEAGGHQTRAG